MPAELRFRAMGTNVQLMAVGGPEGALDAARRMIADLESRWSRFLPASEISQINRHPTRWTQVSPETFRLIEAAVRAWELTAGAFDPTVLRALLAAGYDRSFELLATAPDPAPQVAPTAMPVWVPGAGAIELDEQNWSVRSVEGVGLDLGGIAKGRTADLVVAGLLTAGAAGALANLGGDIRVAGDAPTEHGWRVAAAHPLTKDPLMTVAVADGAVVTSTRTRRTWESNGSAQHHLIDPRRAAPASSGLASVTVVASSAMWGEVVAKAAFVLGAAEGAALIAEVGATGFLVEDAGAVTEFPGLDTYRSAGRVPAHLVGAR